MRRKASYPAYSLRVKLQALSQQIDKPFAIHVHHNRGVGFISAEEIVIHYGHALRVFSLRLYADPAFNGGKQFGL